MNTQSIIQEASKLSLEDKALIIDSLIQTLEPMDTDIEKEWTDLAQKRLAEITQGKAKIVSGSEVLEKVKNRLKL